MKTQWAGRRPSINVFRVLALQWVHNAHYSRSYHAAMYALRLHYITQSHLAESAPEPIVRHVTDIPRSRPVAGPRRAWDTNALRANAQTVLRALAPLADADPHSADPEERKLADITPSPALWNSWRIVRLCRRYREVGLVVDKIKSQALADCHCYTYTLPTAAASPVAESTAERAERRWRDKHFPAMSLIACELRAIDRRIYGEISLQAEREGEMASRLSRYRLKRPKTGHSAPDSPYVKIQRYPRRRAVRAWIKFCQADMYLLCYGTPNPNKRRDDEIVTAADRQRRYAKRVRKAIIRAATGIAQTAEGLSALEKILAAARERMGIAS